MELMWLTVRGSRPLDASSLYADITLKAEKSTTLNKETEKFMIYIRCAGPDLLIQQTEHFRPETTSALRIQMLEHKMMLTCL